MFSKKSHLHFIGIGGIGMSGLALILKKMGYKVTGCDSMLDQRSIKDLIEVGCQIGHNNSQSCSDPSINYMVYSSAINANNPELVAARTRTIPLVHRSEILAYLMRSKTSLAVAGSHGKTTTTSILSHILIETDTDPTVVIGGHLQSINNNARLGNSDYLVAEADESDRSLLNLFPTIALLTNIDFDHAETYTDLEDVKATFKLFLDRLPFYGKAIVNGDDKNIQSLLPTIKSPFVTYGFCPQVDWKITNVQYETTFSHLFLEKNGAEYGPIKIPMPGEHNVYNSVAAFVAAKAFGLSAETIIKTIETFAGVDRRFTFKGSYNGARIIDDYGHHPTEVANALKIARAQTTGKLSVLFQPHRYSRTQRFWNEFLEIFLESEIDDLILTDIYAASEEPIKTITSQNMVKALKEASPKFTVQYLPIEDDFSSLLAYFKKTLAQNDLLMLQGAGRVNKMADKLIS